MNKIHKTAIVSKNSIIGDNVIIGPYVVIDEFYLTTSDGDDIIEFNKIIPEHQKHKIYEIA